MRPTTLLETRAPNGGGRSLKECTERPRKAAGLWMRLLLSDLGISDHSTTPGKRKPRLNVEKHTANLTWARTSLAGSFSKRGSSKMMPNEARLSMYVILSKN